MSLLSRRGQRQRRSNLLHFNINDRLQYGKFDGITPAMTLKLAVYIATTAPHFNNRGITPETAQSSGHGCSTPVRAVARVGLAPFHRGYGPLDDPKSGQ